MNIILGNGQVGKALKPHIKEVFGVYDKGDWEELEPASHCEWLHICIPYSDSFIEIVRHAKMVFMPKYVVIHSTVSPGTTSEILHAIYSPINGRETDKFSEDMKLYPKLAAGNPDIISEYRKQMKLDVLDAGENTDQLEFAKISCTNYVYWNLVFQKSIKKVCDERNYNFDLVYNQWNEMYNLGMSKKYQNMNRPIYYHDPDPVPGGHCIPMNIYLDENFISGILKEWQRTKGNPKFISVGGE